MAFYCQAFMQEWLRKYERKEIAGYVIKKEHNERKNWKKCICRKGLIMVIKQSLP